MAYIPGTRTIVGRDRYLKKLNVVAFDAINPNQCQSFSTNYGLDCAGCENTDYLNDATECLTVCPDGKYGDTPTMTCRNCNEKCLTCSGGATSCTSCTLKVLDPYIN